jgi:hypothetical protein
MAADNERRTRFAVVECESTIGFFNAFEGEIYSLRTPKSSQLTLYQ